MVKEKENCYYCEACEIVYKDKKKACECEDFCRKNKACNIDIIKYAIKEIPK
tara:strand:+ start:12925 stop:13080 length:156 start_codon:yes stop_codon:yes gene_type:complete